MLQETAITKPPAAAQAYRALERMVVMMGLPPGSVTTEGALIQRLGLGRTPVREAIQRLAWEGLLEVRPRAGISVAPLNAADWQRVIEARHAVEVLLARSAARFVTSMMTNRLHEAALRMHHAVAEDDVSAFLEADKELDEAIAAAAENPFAVRLAAPLQTHSRRFWYRYCAEAGLAKAAEQHVRVIRAIVERDETRAGMEADTLMKLLRDYAQSVALA